MRRGGDEAGARMRDAERRRRERERETKRILSPRWRKRKEWKASERRRKCRDGASEGARESKRARGWKKEGELSGGGGKSGAASGAGGCNAG